MRGYHTVLGERMKHFIVSKWPQTFTTLTRETQSIPRSILRSATRQHAMRLQTRCGSSDDAGTVAYRRIEAPLTDVNRM